MAAISSSRQTFLPKVILEVEYGKIVMSISDMFSFAPHSSLNIDGI